MGCALNPTHVIYVGLFFDFSFSTSVLLHWWIPGLWPLTSSLVLNLKKTKTKKNVAFLLSQPNKIALWKQQKKESTENVRSVRKLHAEIQVDNKSSIHRECRVA